MAKEIRQEAKQIADGIRACLADDSQGRRSIRWLADRSGIKYQTLQWRLRERPDTFDLDELFAISDALGVDLGDLPKMAAA